MYPSVTDQHIHQKGAWVLCFAVLAAGFNANIALAQTATQKQVLKKCGVGLVLPGWLPPGFRMAQFRLENCSASRFPGYEITYKGPSQCEIRMNGQNGGFGDAGLLRREWQVKTKLFGTVVLQELEQGSKSNSLNAKLWDMPYFQFYPKTGYIYEFGCENKLFNVNDAKKVLQGSVLAP
jgi:hypothetical protein